MPAIYGYSLFPFDLGHEGRHTYTNFFYYSHPASRMGSQFSLVQKGADYFYFVCGRRWATITILQKTLGLLLFGFGVETVWPQRGCTIISAT